MSFLTDVIDPMLRNPTVSVPLGVVDVLGMAKPPVEPIRRQSVRGMRPAPDPRLHLRYAQKLAGVAHLTVAKEVECW
jgi:hypothetical protein